MTPASGPPIRIEISADGMLIDERHYGVQAYRLGSFLPKRENNAGGTWNFSFRIEIASPMGSSR